MIFIICLGLSAFINNNIILSDSWVGFTWVQIMEKHTHDTNLELECCHWRKCQQVYISNVSLCGEKLWTYQAKYTAIQECTCMNNTSDRHSFSTQRMQYTSLQFTSYYTYRTLTLSWILQIICTMYSLFPCVCVWNRNKYKICK